MKTAKILVLTALLTLAACAGEPKKADSASEEDDLRAQSTTLTFPLIAHEYKGDGEWVTLPLESLNVELERAGLEPFEKAITVGRSAADKARFEAIVARVEAAKEKLGREIEFMQGWDPSEYVGLCYTGVVSGVRKTVDALSGAAFATYMGMPAYRYKNTKEFLYGGDEAEFWDGHRDENGDKVAIWEEFDTSSDAFLMMTDGGEQGDGTELFATVIPKCP